MFLLEIWRSIFQGKSDKRVFSPKRGKFPVKIPTQGKKILANSCPLRLYSANGCSECQPNLTRIQSPFRHSYPQKGKGNFL